MRIVMFDAEKKAYVIDVEYLASKNRNRIGLGGGRFLDYFNHRWHLSDKGKNLGIFQAWEIIGDNSRSFYHPGQYSSV